MIHHGKPSGIDNSITVYGGLLHFQKTQPIELVKKKLQLKYKIWLINSGKERNTKLCVANIRNQLNDSKTCVRAKKLIDEIG